MFGSHYNISIFVKLQEANLFEPEIVRSSCLNMVYLKNRKGVSTAVAKIQRKFNSQVQHVFVNGIIKNASFNAIIQTKE